MAFFSEGEDGGLLPAARAAAAAARRNLGDLGRVGRCQPWTEVTRLAGRGGVRVEAEVESDVDAMVFGDFGGVCSIAGREGSLFLFVDLTVCGEGVLRS